MVETLFWIVVGAVIGWVVPQPAWAAPLVERVSKFWPGR